ncbi:MAG TPA: hypothetical protein VKH44_09945 [Pirellulaceae bacterium]|nr:hypothetical protein [Pirellulaceae bacterium]
MPVLLPRLKNRFRVCLVLGLIAPLTVGCASAPPSASSAAAPPTSATAGNQTIVAISPAAAPQQNLLDFLGITAIGKCLGQGVTCLAGMLPNIIPGFNSGLGELANMPPVLPINDPANLKSPNPAVAAAAAAKRDDDAAPQKIAALEYLATRGCSSCVPGAEEAMYSGLEDCTESVRFTAATAIYEAAGKPCRVCKAATCCSTKIRQKLWELGYKLNDAGCPVEPSPRVRRTARLALRACGPDCNPQIVPPVPTEGPDLEMPTPVTPRPPNPAVDARIPEIPGAPPAAASR